MKKLFIIVSVIAMAYLAMQTNTVQQVKSALFTGDSSSAQHADEVLADNKAVLDIDVINQKFSQLAEQNTALIVQVQKLEQSTKALERKLAQQLVESTSTPASTALSTADMAQSDQSLQLSQTSQPGQPTSSAQLLQSPQSSSFARVLQAPSPADVQKNASTVDYGERQDAQKRIQQQAILRDLSQKMELAALSGLSN